jgi:hypothetical protein
MNEVQQSALQQPELKPIRSWAVAAILLDYGVQPVSATADGPVITFWFRAQQASAVLGRWQNLKEQLDRFADAARSGTHQ